MDLRSIINTENGEGGRSKQNAPIPVTPIQTGPPLGQIFRSYSHSSQVSQGPGKHGSQSQEYASQNGGPYASPTTYQAAVHPGPGRPPPPTPIQPNDHRSSAGSYSAPSPYRHTPTSSISVAGGQYPFPHNLQNPQSPAQHNQYPPTFHQTQRDSYSQSNPPPQLQQYNSQVYASQAPQTPPIGIPGATHPYLQHQRSQSSLSIATPTLAHSQQQQQQQQQYQNQFTQDSPISTNQFPPNQFSIRHQRQQSHQSQPGTPLGPPIQTQLQSSGPFTQPTSPYQQRGVVANPLTSTQYHQISPAPANASIPPRMPTTPRNAYESQSSSTSSTQQRSVSERERSLSVSPKTRLPSQTRGNSMIQQQPEEYNNSTKRKMEDREISFEAPQRVEQDDVKPQINGDYRSNSVATPSPQQPAKKRFRYTEPPIWARSAKGIKGLGRKTNGRQLTPQPSAQVPPATLIKQESNGVRQASPAIPRPVAGNDYDCDGPLGPWEPSISGRKPPAEMTRLVADFLFRHVVSREDTRELVSRGVEVEIEAKLGQLVSKETNQRLNLPIRSETVLMDNQFIAFKSTMTEVQHKNLNEFLNQKVQECYPNNPSQPKRRVQIEYLHRRETDKFYELPSSMHATLPPALRALLNPRYSVKVRVTHDQKTGEVLAKIIKARVADLDIFFPSLILDCRISINFEMRFDGDIEDLITSSDGAQRPDRNKDRLSYKQSHYQVDLTQVTQSLVSNGITRAEKEHELEIELSTAAVKEQGLKARNGEPNDYAKLVEGLIDNVRLLARTASPVPTI
ncbi:hypothetical protein SBOR_8525 [Sclerotinia borealis F-4128]|uniref:mRNA-capping enzyme subunit beta n=1 Tax=Sclerotinia borealis (strain F-4128) TaxID=1432307 RepID=W9C2S1_SCLBF|nr:hypothetical protein SBOR_8525 [Sclerotinia borealis F-4128]